jgi:hypothetical protein
VGVEGPATRPVRGGVAGSLWRAGVAPFVLDTFNDVEARGLVGRTGLGITVSAIAGTEGRSFGVGEGEGEGEGRGDDTGDEVGGGSLLALFRPYPAVVTCLSSFSRPVSSRPNLVPDPLSSLLGSRVVVKVACSALDPLLDNLEELLLPRTAGRLPEDPNEGDDADIPSFFPVFIGITSLLPFPSFLSPFSPSSLSLSLSVPEVIPFRGIYRVFLFAYVRRGGPG